MDAQTNRSLQQFREEVGIRFQLYNSLFTSLPFHRIEKTGILLSLLSNNCEEGYKKNLSPIRIIDEFITKQTTLTNDKEKTDLLFRFVQYVERQVVLFDALEDAAFNQVNDLNGVGTLKHLESEVIRENEEDLLAEKLKDFSIRLVLTAHPTQFYPGAVLGIINDLSKALKENNSSLINSYLQQLGKTPFLQKHKPTPFDEAVSLIWFLENVFYNASGQILSAIRTQFPQAVSEENPIIRMGFWPGGDRDGNPFVTAEITSQVAEALRASILKCYYFDIRRLRRRLTFTGVDTVLTELEQKLYDSIFVPGHKMELTKAELLSTLDNVKQTIIYKHNGLFLHMVNNMINKIELFGLYFASLDVRQESTVHGKALHAIAESGKALPKGYAELTDEKKIDALFAVTETVSPDLIEDPVQQDTLKVIGDIKKIQSVNGEDGCNRYVISQCNSALNAIEVFGLFLLAGWKTEELSVDIVPLFETITDLEQAREIMRTLYSHPVYREHLKRRKNRQTIMVGFSDGTKDGGYLMANFGIYKAKKELTAISKEYGIDVIFFDGRGGPPSRGGRKTHKFYASMGKDISNEEIQLTIQGQTISSNFGTVDSAKYNMEQLMNAGLINQLFATQEETLDATEEQLLLELSQTGFDLYKGLRDHPYLADYLIHASPLRFYSETNIGSRPAKRGGASGLSLKDLRAIPFAGSWSQLKQNVTGFYGVGTALQKA
ncbi:MAG: phosphoenolpyruvate carboxylase, partial [Chitinophagaceae bacterium]